MPFPLLPYSEVAFVTPEGKPTQDAYRWYRGLQRLLQYSYSELDLGTASGTVTPNPTAGLKQRIINNGAFTIAATSEIGDMELRVTNGSSAGAITFTGFEKQFTGDALTTTNGHQFVIFIYGFDGTQAYMIKAMQ